MAFSAVTERGTAGSTTSDTSLGVSPSANLTVGKIVFAVLAFDNIATADGASTTNDTLTDTDGHTWTKVYERTRSDGVAADGATGSLWWTKVTTQIDTGDTVTFDVDSAVTAKCIGLFEVTVSAGNTIQLAGSTFLEATGNNPGPLTLSGLPSKEYLLIGAAHSEGNGITWTEDADYTNVYAAEGFTSAAGGVATERVRVRIGYRIATLTGDTFQPTGLGNADHALALVAFEEVASGNTGTIGVTQAGDTAAITGSLNISGTVASTQADQTSAMSGTVANPITGTVAASQADQSGAFTGSLNISGTVAATQANQTSAISGTVANPITGTIGAIQADDTGAFTGDIVSDGTLNAIQANQIGAINGTVVNPITGVLAVTQDDDDGAFTGISLVDITGVLGAIQEDQTAALTGDSISPAVTGIIDATQDDQTMDATGIALVAVTGVLDETQDDQIGNFVGHNDTPILNPPGTITCVLSGPTATCVLSAATATCTISPVNVIAGSSVEITTTFNKADGTLADPTTVSALIRHPDGTTSNPTPTSSSVGVWTTVIPTDDSGFWFYQISGEGNDLDVVCVGSFCAEPSLVLV